jgi:arylsulfatase A-like enzyme
MPVLSVERMAELPDIVLLTIDALRVDHLSWYGYDRETPTLDTLANEWIDAPTTISISSHTREAMPPLLSGRYPEEFVATGFTQLEPAETLAGRLRAAGYRTGGFHSNPYLSRAYDFDAGFDTFDDDLQFGQHKLLALAQRALDRFVLNRGDYYARAPTINDRALDWLDDIEGPAFLWNHYMDAHGPYHAPERRYAERKQSASNAESLYRRSWKQPESITDEERQLLVDSYDDEIRYLDDHLGRFLDALRERGRFEDALVVVTADHGDAFGEHGYYTHPRHLHEGLLRVPLFVSPPIGMEGTIEAPVSTLDVVPTLLKHARTTHEDLPGTPLATPDGHVSGREGVVFASAAGENENDGLRRFAARDERWKALLEREVSDGDVLEREAFDLDTDADEQVPLSPDVSDEAHALVHRLEQYSRERLNGTTGEQESVETTAEIDDRLEALGYK